MQKEKSIRRIVRDYNISSDIFILKADSGQLIYVDIGSVNPYNFISNFLNRFDQLSRDEEEGVVKDLFRSIGYSLSPFIKQDFIFNRLISAYEALSGGRIPEDNYGKKIYREQDPAYVKGIELSKYIGGVFTPGMVKNLFRAREMAIGGNQDGADAEIFSTFTMRKVAIDGNVWFYNRLAKGQNPYVKDIESYKTDYFRVANKNISDEEKDAAFLKSVNNIKNVISTISKDFRAGLDIGTDENKLYESMIKSGLKEDNIAAIIESANGNIEKLENEFFLQKRH